MASVKVANGLSEGGRWPQLRWQVASMNSEGDNDGITERVGSFSEGGSRSITVMLM